MPLTDRSKAKEGGFAQAREALVKFEGTVTSATFDKWGGKLVDDDGKPIPPREFLEIQCTDVQVLEVTEELSMPIDEWNFRVNCSEFKGSFWVEKFLESADKFKILIPDGLVGKRVTFQKVTLEAFDRAGTPNPKFNSTNYVIVGVKSGVAPKVVAKIALTKVSAKGTVPALAIQPEEVPAETAEASEFVTPDPMEAALNLAVGKTEAQFRMAIGMDTAFVGSPLLSLAKAGMVTQDLINKGKLVLVTQGKQQVYQKPG